MLFSSTFISIIEVLMVLLPALLSVAYVTVAERKTMASMQRRVGPNFVGVYGSLQPLNKLLHHRQFHTSRKLNNSPKKNNKRKKLAKHNNKKGVNSQSLWTSWLPKISLLPLDKPIIAKAIKGLYKDRVSPVLAFGESVLVTCSNILNPKEREVFLGKIGKLGGLYIIQYKHDPLIYYIGRTSCFRNRFYAHIISTDKDKFHLFGRLVGWENFNISVIKLCSISKQGALESAYLQKYLPLLNSAFISYGTETSIAQSLSNLLESKRTTAINSSQGLGLAIWVYKLYDTYIGKTPVAEYQSVNQASISTGNARATIGRYLNTNVPLKGLLYYTNPLTAFDEAFKVTKGILENLNLKLNHSAPIKVWVYNAITLELVNGKPFNSIGELTRSLDILLKTVTYFLDKWKPENSQGLYFFSRPLTHAEIAKLVALHKEKGDKIFHKVKVWVYNATTLDLIGGEAFKSMQAAADYFKVNYRTMQYHMDTKLAVTRNGQLVYIFSQELSPELKSELVFNFTGESKLARNVSTQVWVYNKLEDGSMQLINDDMPFKTKSLACKELKMSGKKLNRIINTNEAYKGLLFYSIKQ